MASFNMEVSGLSFHIASVYDYAEKFCSSFLISETGTHHITLTQDDIYRERLLCAETDEIAHLPDFYLETVCLLRKIADHIVSYHRILMHGSAICVNGKGYIFTAPSGTGKSTHTAMLKKLFGDQAVMVNDDKPFLHITDQGVFVCGTPWMGKHNLGNNMCVPLAGIFFLRRSEENVLERIEPSKAVSRLIAQCHRPEDPEKMMLSFDMFDKILNSVALYDLGCNMDISAAQLSASIMK